MKQWENPAVFELGIEKTNVVSDYIITCNWNGIMTLGTGNEEYTDPNTRPEKHPTWVWCEVHSRWHPKDHTGEVSQS